MLKHTGFNVFDCWYSLSNHYRYMSSATIERFLTISSNNVLKVCILSTGRPVRTAHGMARVAVPLVCDRLLSLGKAAFDGEEDARMEAEAQQNTRSVNGATSVGRK